LGSQISNPEVKKSIILFTGAHHARELVTAGMIVKIFIESLHSLIHDLKVEHWKFNDLLIIPIVNLDSYKFITDSYDTPEWITNKWKRKSMNKEWCPK